MAAEPGGIPLLGDKRTDGTYWRETFATPEDGLRLERWDCVNLGMCHDGAYVAWAMALAVVALSGWLLWRIVRFVRSGALGKALAPLTRLSLLHWCLLFSTGSNVAVALMIGWFFYAQPVIRTNGYATIDNSNAIEVLVRQP